MKEKIKIMHAADLHLGAELSFLEGSKRSERKAELILSAERLFECCKNSGVELILLAGDIFENNAVDESIVSAFYNCINKAEGIPVVLAAGNHDPLTCDSPFLKYPMPKNLFVLGTGDECIYLESINARVYGRSFKSVYMQGQESFGILPEDDGTINIMVLHGELGTDISGNYNTVTKEFIRNSRMDYIALGHIHTFSGILKEGKTYYAYPGCPESHGFDEPGSKGAIFAEISKGECQFKFVPTALRTHEILNIDISGIDSSAAAADTVLAEIKERFPKNFGRNLYKIILTGSIPEGVKIDSADIARRISDSVFYIKVKDRAEIAVNLELLSKEKSLKGIFVKKMLMKIGAEGDPDGELRQALFLGLKAFNSEVKFNED